MIRQTRVTLKTASATLTYAEMGDIVCNSSSTITLTLPAASPGLWYRISNIGSGAVTAGDITINKGEQGLCVATSVWYFSKGGGGELTKAQVEAVLTGEITSHSHPEDLTKEEIEAVLTGEITSHSHPSPDIPQATGTTLGGVKASAKTSAETQEVKIDTITGKLFSTPPSAAANGLPAGGSAGQFLAKNSPIDYDATWVDAQSGGGGSSVPQRQCVLNGSVDTNGIPNYLAIAAGGGLAVDLTATIPLRLAFAWGFDAGGAVDYVGSVTSDVANAWTGLAANEECALYVDRNILTGALTYGFTLLAPVYSPFPPSTPSNDQHWFDINAMKMKVYNSGTSAWDEVQRVFVGTAYTDESATTAVKHFPIRHDFLSEWDSPERYPTLPSKYDDDGDGCSVAPWSWLNQGSATIVNTRGKQVLTVPAVADSGLVCRVQAAPSGAFAWQAKLNGTQRQVNYYQYGLVAYNSGNSKLLGWIIDARGTVTKINVVRWINATTFSAEPFTVETVITLPVWLKVVYDATNFNVYFSYDGESWSTLTLYTEALATFLGAVTHFGFTNRVVNTTAGNTVYIEQFRVS